MQNFGVRESAHADEIEVLKSAKVVLECRLERQGGLCRDLLRRVPQASPCSSDDFVKFVLA
eukprot:15943676-Heterocapsa_arctica.AAC.1